MPTSIERFSEALSANASDFGIQPKDRDIKGLRDFYVLVTKWNPKLHLVAPCSPEEFATRHVLESLMLLRHLSPEARVIDVGSGAGLPIIPCLIVRDDLRVTLIESSQRKAVFLREALRIVSSREPALLLLKRFEETIAPEADFVTCRALDRFQQLLPALIKWAPPTSTFLLFTGDVLRRQIEALLPSVRVERIPKSERRFLVIAGQDVSRQSDRPN